MERVDRIMRGREMLNSFGRGNRKASKVTAVQVEVMRQKYEQGMTQRELALEYRLSIGQVGRIVRGESWQDTGAARGYVEREAWRAVERGEMGEGRLRGVPAEGEMIEESLRRVIERVEWEKGVEEEKGVGLVGAVPEGIVERMRALLGKEERELGPVGVEELPVGNG